MVIRQYVQCATCDEKYMLRVGVGIEPYEIHFFDCIGCDLPITIALQSKAPHAHVKPLENVIAIEEQHDEDVTIINLHPNFAFDVNEINSNLTFASMAYLHKISPFMRMVPGRYQDVARQFDIPNATFLWGHIKKILLLRDKDSKSKIVEKNINIYEQQRRKIFPDTSISNHYQAVYNFFYGLFHPKFENLLNPAQVLVEKAKNDFPDEFEKYKVYYLSNLKRESDQRYISIFNDYFKLRTELCQMLIHARIGDFDIENKVVGSRNFDIVKLFYGQAYETLTSQFVTFACINNILSRRKFDEFMAMNLNKYIKDLEKSKKANPFSGVPEFYSFATHLDSALRNGSHHASIWREGGIVKYKSGGNGAAREMNYSRYLYLCNELIIAISALCLLEMKLEEM